MNPMHREPQNFAPGSPTALEMRTARGKNSWLALLGSLCAVATLCGCNAWQPATYNPPEFFGPQPVVMPQTLPLVINSTDQDFVWDQIVDVVDDYFRIEHEERVRIVGDLPTEGRLSTYPRGASTILEPWNQDSVTSYERWHATFQSMRRRATVYVVPLPDGTGYQVDVQVYKELEDVARPESGSISLANSQTLRNDDALIRLTNPVGGQEPTRGWIGLGRDMALEQVIISGIQARTGGMLVPAEQFQVPLQ